MQRLWLVLALAGCPAPSRYIIADVTASRVPVPGALVAADCGNPHEPALRTDEDGRARMMVNDRQNCSLLVAKPGYPTVTTGPVNVCPSGACTPTRIDLAPRTPAVVRSAPPRIEPEMPRRPLEVAQ
jgi:hypothetical protein